MDMRPVLHSFAYTLDHLRQQVADVDPADMAAQPGGIRNHPAWTIGHLAFTCQMLGGVLGERPWLPDDWASRFGPGSEPVADASLYPPKDALLAALADTQARITRAVEAQDARRLDDPFPDPSYRDVFPTIRHALTQVLVGHAAYHVGQLGPWRRAKGLPPVRRSYE